MNYRRLTKNNSRKNLVIVLKAGLVTGLVSVISFLGAKGLSEQAHLTESVLADNVVATKAVEETDEQSSEESTVTFEEVVVTSEDTSNDSEILAAVAEQATQELSAVETFSTPVIPATEQTYLASAEVAVTYYEPATITYSDSTSYYPTTLANGNTAGEIGSAAAAQMAAATGVPQETWEYIIARESNGDPYAANASGASGLFQTIPGWGSTATVEDQINTAIHVYNTQGMSAWGF